MSLRGRRAEVAPRAGRCVAAVWRYAASLGAETHPGWKAVSLETLKGEMRVTSESGEAIDAKVRPSLSYRSLTSQGEVARVRWQG